jgi:hypothetical protein
MKMFDFNKIEKLLYFGMEVAIVSSAIAAAVKYNVYIANQI